MAEIKMYQKSIEYIANLDLPWEKIDGKTVMISGATGMIGTFLIEVLFLRCKGIKVIALGRNEDSAKLRFGQYWDQDNFKFIAHNINLPLHDVEHVDFIIHAASNTHPIAYSTDPVGTITTNVIGTYNLLEFAKTCKNPRFLFASSVEVYGENKGDVDYFNETYCGYINCNTLRAGYPESKRTGEALCQAYISSAGMDIVIARLARTYGPTMLSSDTKAISQFLKKGCNGENIVLKSEGNQLFSYNYVADSVSGLLTILLLGNSGEAYNIADKQSDITLKELAQMIADYAGTKVKFDLPDQKESRGYSTATKAIMNSDKLQALGWKANWTIKEGIWETLRCLS